MFTGIVTAIGHIASVEQRGDLRVQITCPWDPAGIAIGASIACSGVCLTVVRRGGEPGAAWFAVDVSAETVSRTAKGMWAEGRALNLEPSLRLGDELGGHIVTGHVDGVAELVARETVTQDGPWGATARFTLRAPQGTAGFIAEKGSVALDGTSLTVNRVDRDLFSVLLIPHTLDVTNWGPRQPGDRINCEIDMMARYAARLAEARAGGY